MRVHRDDGKQVFSFRQPGNRNVQYVAYGLAALMAVTISDIPQAKPAAAAPAPSPAVAEQPLERADEAAALVTARLTGKPVTGGSPTSNGDQGREGEWQTITT